MISGFIVGIFILFIIGYFLMNLIYRGTNAYKNSLIEVMGIKESLKHKVAIVNTGSTYSKFAFDGFGKLKIKGFNMALSRQSLEADYVLLKSYSAHVPEDSVVCITLAACSMLYNQSMCIDSSLYYVITGSGINEFNLFDWLRSRLPLFPFKIRKAFPLIKDIPLKYELKNNADTILSEEEATIGMTNLAEIWVKLFHLSDLVHKQLSGVNKQDLENNEKLLFCIVNYCKSKSWRPVFVIPPFSKYLNSQFSERFIETVLTSVIYRIAGLQNIPVFNYQYAEAFQNDLSLYVDGGFRLSKIGSVKFIKMLFADMTRYGIRADNSTMGIYS